MKKSIVKNNNSARVIIRILVAAFYLFTFPMMVGADVVKLTAMVLLPDRPIFLNIMGHSGTWMPK
ncbi:MAG: hypothetical protein GY749_12845 [Desulfobacteraceae bacterium]|nr:hypothetical protein [Desulfobacteraceae bacterium]